MKRGSRNKITQVEFSCLKNCHSVLLHLGGIHPICKCQLFLVVGGGPWLYCAPPIHRKPCSQEQGLSLALLQERAQLCRFRGEEKHISHTGVRTEDWHTKETRIERDTCTPMFIAALFIIARTWKQPRCPSADEWIRKLWYIHTMGYYSVIKKNTFESVLMRWMKLEPIIQSEVSQKEKHQYSILMHVYGI